MNIDKQKIEYYCDKHNYGYKIFENDVIITTSMDEWRITIDDSDSLLVQHLNKAGNRTAKCNYHIQRYAPDWEYVFEIIISRHENYDTVYNKAFRIENILKELKLA